MVVVFVTGDRKWHNKDLIHKTLAEFPKGTWLLEGGAGGADRLSREVGFALGFQPFTAYANWGVYHRAAGPMRNQAMGELLAILVKAGLKVHAFAFHNDLSRSKGTKDMLKILKRIGIECPVIHDP